MVCGLMVGHDCLGGLFQPLRSYDCIKEQNENMAPNFIPFSCVRAYLPLAYLPKVPKNSPALPYGGDPDGLLGQPGYSFSFHTHVKVDPNRKESISIFYSCEEAQGEG